MDTHDLDVEKLAGEITANLIISTVQKNTSLKQLIEIQPVDKFRFEVQIQLFFL